MKHQRLLEQIHQQVGELIGQGEVASYIPALARVDPDQFGFALCGVDGSEASVGSADTPFSIQSVSKVFSLSLALQLIGEQLWERIGREPSGDPFNSLVQLEHEHGKPRNPFINAGAIAVADRLVSHCVDAKRSLLEMVSGLLDSPVDYDYEVAASEAAHGSRNAATAHFMRSFGNLDNPVEVVLDVYFHQCALTLSCRQMARACAYLANGGVNPGTGGRVLTERQVRRINALMLTCGTYDVAGEFAFMIGLPCKSGVGGGIIATVPEQMSLCVWSPALGPSGNSLAGTKALELFAAEAGVSVF
ncbi:MAG: glutaminase [Xanthomonadales bacterium]|nr:glutaminase [Xanthomonadales bacterium]